MNWTGLFNWIGSSVGFGVTAFLSTFFLDANMDIKTRIYAAVVTAGVALVQHMRENPFKL